MIGDVSFYSPLFKPNVYYRVCDDSINRAGNLSSNKLEFINFSNHQKRKNKTYKILN